jgi:hypothetical protein
LNLDWRRLRAVVIESDDWGLCAWVPDEQAYRVMADTPAWRGAAGRVYGRSTLEGAEDIERLASTLLEFRGGDGFPPILQANMVMAAPDFARLVPPLFETETLPLVDLPRLPSRWQRPGMWEQVQRAREAGVWWPELHGLHHVPENAYLKALRRGLADARRGHEQECLVCEEVQSSGEYAASEPEEVRKRNLAGAVERFTRLIGRTPGSFCPPDYRWTDSLDAEAERLGVHNFQGKAERVGAALPRMRRLLHRYRWPDLNGKRFYLPPRIAFEPRGGRDRHASLGTEAVHRAVRAAWSRGQPAVISTHRANYAHLDAGWSEVGRASLRALLTRLMGDGAVFLTDLEVRELLERGWSVRMVGQRGALLRYYGVPREPVSFPAPDGVGFAALQETRAGDPARVIVADGQVRCEVSPGEYLLEWKRG